MIEMKRNLLLFSLIIFSSFFCGELTRAEEAAFVMTFRVEIEQSHEIESIPQWEWSGNFVHILTVSLTELESFWNQSRFVPRKQTLSEGQAKGIDFCRTGEPSEEYTIQWSSKLYWDTSDEPTLFILERGKEAWILYDLPRAVEIKHPGAPPCGPGHGIEPNSIQERYFFIDDLEEESSSLGDYPVYVYDEGRASGGFFLLAVPQEDLKAGTGISKTVLYQGQYNKLRIQVKIGSIS
jgi:hypothetical protein